MSILVKEAFSWHFTFQTLYDGHTSLKKIYMYINVYSSSLKFPNPYHESSKFVTNKILKIQATDIIFNI